MKSVLFIATLVFCFNTLFGQTRHYIDDLNEVYGVYYSKIDNKPVTGII